MKGNSKAKGTLFQILAMLIISIQNIIIKLIGGDHSALEIVAIRSVVVLPTTLVF